MKIKSIILNTETVQAILNGKKTCIRKIIKPTQFIGLLPDKCKNAMPEEFIKEKRLMFKPYCDMTDSELISTVYNSPYQQGDVLYVRETVWQKIGHYLDVDGETKPSWYNEFRYVASDEMAGIYENRKRATEVFSEMICEGWNSENLSVLCQ